MGKTILRHGDEIRLGDSITFLFINEPQNTTTSPTIAPSSPDPEHTIVDSTPLVLPLAPKKPGKEDEDPSPKQGVTEDEFILPEQPNNTKRNRLRLFGCGCLVILIPLFCVATLVFLDFYEQGRFLYCGSLRPIFEIILGPLGFAPICP